MKGNEGGFTYPLTLSILVVFLFFFSIRIEQLLIERKMAHETKKIIEQEYYMLSSANKIEETLQEMGSIEPKGTFIYKYGKLDYQANTPTKGLQAVTFTLQLDSGEVSIGIGSFDIGLKKMVKWIEKN